jgi:hypothetical protein
MLADNTPFSQPARMRVFEQYLANAGSITEDNAWEHVYRCLLWWNEGAGLAHIYDSNHMQPGKPWHYRAQRFTDSLASLWNTDRRGVKHQLDVLFKGCVTELRRRGPNAAADLFDDENSDPSEFVERVRAALREKGIDDDELVGTLEREARDHFTVGKKRSNALGEGFEDLLSLLIERAAHVSADRIKLRTPLSKLPGFRQPPPPPPGEKKRREPSPDLAIVEGDLTQVIITAKWSMRQDRQQQFAFEFRDFQTNYKRDLEMTYSLITNEFDLARLKNVADAMPTNNAGYIFHNIYHINLDLLRLVHNDDLGRVGHYIGTGKIRSLSDFLRELRTQFGNG